MRDIPDDIEPRRYQRIEAAGFVDINRRVVTDYVVDEAPGQRGIDSVEGTGAGSERSDDRPRHLGESGDAPRHGYRELPLKAFRDRYPDDYLEPWHRTLPIERFQAPERLVREINPDREAIDSYRVNCADCSRAFERTWRGNLEEAAGRSMNIMSEGGLEAHGEQSDRTEEWAGEKFTELAEVDEIHDRLLTSGHGASAIVHSEYTDGDGCIGGHAFNAVNYDGKVKVVDAQWGRVYAWSRGVGHPDFAAVTNVRAMGWDKEGRPLW